MGEYLEMDSDNIGAEMKDIETVLDDDDETQPPMSPVFHINRPVVDENYIDEELETKR